jgi:hypothetical protein
MSRALFEQSLLEKKMKNDFLNDMTLLLPVDNDWSFDEGFKLVWEQLISCIPGEPWGGKVSSSK